MFLINIPIIQAPQRLVGPTGSNTGGGESSPGDPVCQCMFHPSQQLGSRSNHSPGQQAALWECLAVGGPCSAGQGCGQLETSPAPVTRMGMTAPRGLEQCPWPWAGWCVSRTAHRMKKAGISPSKLHSFSNSFKK